MLFIYTPHDSPRLDFAFDFIFNECLKTPVSLVESLSEVDEGQPLLVYSYVRPDQDAAWIFPHDLAIEFTIAEQQIEVFSYRDHPVFFGTGSDEEIKADLPYDPFALVFFMLSRYEEYIDTVKDEHGRFPAKRSAAWKHGFLEHPVVDYAVDDIRELLQRKWPALNLQTGEFKIELSYDIDSPFAFYGKSPLKNAAAGIRDAITMQNKGRLAYVAGNRPDPFDIFDDLLQQLDSHGLKARFFVLLEHRGKNNPSIDHRDEKFREIVRKLGDAHQLGIHPSYNCDKPDTLGTETSRFQEITGYQPEHSRFHFIKMSLPSSYHLIYHSGIFHDHSMGFPDHIGFRAGTSRKFNFYDLSAEVMTDLIIHPFSIMDATFEYYLKDLSMEDVVEKIGVITGRIRNAGGTAAYVFHNDLISSYPSRFDWASIHKMTLEMLH